MWGKDMIQIQLRPEIEARLSAEAQARGVALERYIVEKLSESSAEKHPRQASIVEAIDRIHDLRKGNRLGEIKIRDLVHDGHKY